MFIHRIVSYLFNYSTINSNTLVASNIMLQAVYVVPRSNRQGRATWTSPPGETVERGGVSVLRDFVPNTVDT